MLTGPFVILSIGGRRQAPGVEESRIEPLLTAGFLLASLADELLFRAYPPADMKASSKA